MITQMKELIGISVNRTAMGKTVKSYNGINNTKCLEYISCKKKINFHDITYIVVVNSTGTIGRLLTPFPGKRIFVSIPRTATPIHWLAFNQNASTSLYKMKYRC